MKKKTEKIKRVDKEKILAYSLKNAVEHDGEAKENSVLNSLFHEGLQKKDVKKVRKAIQKIVNEVNSLSPEKQEIEFRKLEKQISHRKERQGLPPLPRAKKGKVVMRFSPSASGPLHVGHALVLCPSFLYTEKYKGKFYIRIEDTNPENIFPHSYKMIKEEAKWLTKNKAVILIQSKRMSLYYRYIEKLLQKSAYVCTCSQEEFKQLILQKKPCPCRQQTVKENLTKWKKMLNKRGYKEGEAVVRFKSNLKHKNPAMRDFPLARINLKKHHLQKNKYRVWPLMNLAVTVDDMELGMTHIIRAKDHKDNAKRQEMIYKVLKKKAPWTAFIGRIHFKGLEFSTTKMREGIEKKEYSGWDDPRLPTIASLKQKYKPEAFWKLAEQRGISEVDKIMEKKEFFHLLDLFNK